MHLEKLFKQWNKKLVQKDKHGYWKLRVWHRGPRKKQSPRLLVKCGDCDSKFEIYYDDEEGKDLEIAGVLASREEWKRLFGPLLGFEE
jgi:hypothetical protein